MSDKEYTILVEGKEIVINFIGKVMSNLTEMGLDEYPIYGTVLSLGKELLVMEDQTQFIIIDEFQKLGIVGVKDTNTMAVDIIAIVPQSHIFIKNTIRVFRYGMGDGVTV